MLMFIEISFQKGLILVAGEGFPYFIFWKQNLRTLFVLHSKAREKKFLSVLDTVSFCKLQSKKNKMLML